MDLTVRDILGATGGRLAQGAAAAPLNGVSTDSRTVRPGELFVAIEGQRFDGHGFVGRALAAGAGAALVRRWPLGVAPDGPIVQVDDPVAAYGAIASWWLGRMPARVVTVTGSNGKTTVKEMAAHLLDLLGPTLRSEGNHNNHMGVPETLLRVRPEHRFVVVEMGTNRPGELGRLAALAPSDVAIITNVGPSHLEAFGSEQGVAREKVRLLDCLLPGGVAVLHADDEWSRRIALRRKGRKATFGRSADADWRATSVEADDTGIRFELRGVPFAVPVAGEHQVANCLAAVASAAEMGLSVRAAAERLASFAPPKWRMTVHRIGELTLVVDCYNANPASMGAALREVARRRVVGRRVAVLGDMLELGRVTDAAHRAVGRRVAAEGYDLLCAVGERAELLAKTARRQGMSSEQVFWAPDRRAAAEWLCAQLGPQDLVLFKASRGIQLEEVAEAVEDFAAAHLPLEAAPVAGSPASA